MISYRVNRLPLSASPAERFKRMYDVTPSGCWLWNASCVPSGYGCFSIKGRFIAAHRFSYEMAHGPIPAGNEIDHLCRIRRCVNPDHLEAVPHQVNVKRGLRAVPNSHCLRGHPMSGDNLYIYKGRRQCKECNKLKNKRLRAKKAALKDFALFKTPNFRNI